MKAPLPTQQENGWTLLPLLTRATERFEEQGIDSPRLTAELLLGHILHLDRIGLHLNHDRRLTAGEVTAFDALLQRRLSREPLQYITGETEFMGLKFRIDRRALIPRPETEVLVEAVIEHLRATPGSGQKILDVGTGSGNIAAGIAYHVPGSSVDSVDVSAGALALAQENIRAHGLEGRVRLLRADILHAAFPLREESYDVVVSNPPYIAAADLAHLDSEVRDFEPHIALTDSADGLQFFSALGEQSMTLLRKGGWLFVEIAFDQGPAVEKIFLREGYSGVRLIKDYDHHPRVICGKKG